ncbi:MAG: PadR family transcriptional regulator [Streptosporangiales bacterium]|nr:PadR family transcriptional regulator [Streptosporangiales bacterium]
MYSCAVSTVHVLLGLLASRPRHGYELKREHDTRFPAAKPLPYGQVYATLGRLERDGLVLVDGTEQDSGPERTRYAITERGAHALGRWLAQVEEPAPYLGGTMQTKIVLALLTRRSAEPYLRAQREAHLTRMRELTARKSDPGAPMADVLAADYAILHLDADLRWMETTMNRLNDLRAEVGA